MTVHVPSRRLLLAGPFIRRDRRRHGIRSPRRAAKSKESAEARLQRFADKEEIANVLLTYGRALDARDFATYSSLFAADGEWVGGFGSVKGPANIKAFMEKNMGTGGNTTQQLPPALELRHQGERRHRHRVVALGVRAAAGARRRHRAGGPLRRHVRPRERRVEVQEADGVERHRPSGRRAGRPPPRRRQTPSSANRTCGARVGPLPRARSRARRAGVRSLPASSRSRAASTTPRCARPAAATSGSPTASISRRRASARSPTSTPRTSRGSGWRGRTTPARGGGGQEATPLVWNNTIYGITNWSVVFAVDAKTGKEKWRWDPWVNKTEVRPEICCGVVNRGLALYQGMVYVPVIDGRLQALDALDRQAWCGNRASRSRRTTTR